MTIGRLLAVGHTESGEREAQSWKSEKGRKVRKATVEKSQKCWSNSLMWSGNRLEGTLRSLGRSTGFQGGEKGKPGKRKQFEAIHGFAKRSLERKGETYLMRNH